MNNVQIIPDESGNVIRVSKNNPEYGHVRLQQNRLIIGSNGWVKSNSVTTLLHGTVDDLKEMGITDMKTLPGKIVIRESLEPFSTTEPDRDLKIAGDTGIICCSDGQPIYRKTLYVPNLTAEDELIAHTNSDAIRKANGAGVTELIKNLPVETVSKDSIANEIINDFSMDDTADDIEIESEEHVIEEQGKFEL